MFENRQEVRYVLTKQKKITTLLSLILISFLLIANNQAFFQSPTVFAETDQEETVEEVVDSFTFGRKDLYANYLDEHSHHSFPDHEIIIDGAAYSAVEEMDVEVIENFEGIDGSAVITDETGSITWEVDVPEEGLYNIAIRYFPIVGKSSDIEREIWINGELPFQGAATLSFPRSWTNELPEIEQDNRGNDLRPRQVESPIWMEVDLQDSEGYYTEPYYFYFKQGKNTITLVSSREPVAIDYLKIYQVPPVLTYEEVKQTYEQNGYQETKDIMIKVQGEDAYLKSSPTLYAVNDRSSPATEPYHVSKIRMNAIGGYNWRWPGQWITWKVDVPEDGLYKIGIKAKQNMLRGIYSTRKLLINGEVPFKESETIPFYFDHKWVMHELGEEEPYLFYLPKGTHEITLEVTLGDIAPLLRTIEDSVLELNHIYRQILMITGAVPDPYRDYELEKNIPEMLEVFERQSEIIASVADQLEEITGERSDQTAILDTMAYQLKDFVKRPETIQRRLDRYKINVGSLGTWILTVREQPLEIDYLVVASPDQKMPQADTGFLQKVKHEIGNFIYSFIEDYNTIGNVADEDEVEESITVWIGTGRDQAQVLKAMIDDTFTPQTNINVNLKLVQMGVLLPATLAGQGPDVAMQIDNQTPVNYAMRNAVTDLTQFPDYPEVEKRFRESAIVPYRFEDGVYALPEQQIFSMLFYRKDIFEELELEPPETWEDFYNLIPELQKNHMEVALPLVQDPAAEAVQNIVPNETFTMMLYQKDGVLYEDGGKRSGLGSETAIEVFQDWTKLYTNYKLPLRFDFPNRFRTGEMPMGIAEYSFYNHLSVSAPEIRGLWEFIPVPGTVQENGEIRREVGSSGTSVIIMEQAENKEAAWEFLKWWTSKDVQVRFGREMEGLMGAAARYPTANVEALKELPWPVRDYQQLEEQWQWVRGVPEVPGGYFTGRHLDNAFREVVNNGTNPREALNDYIIYIDDEIRVKRKEFNLPIE